MINRRFYQMWRKRGENAASAARLARGSEAITDETIVVSEESDLDRRHKCQCPYTVCLVAKSADSEYFTSLGGICVNSLSDAYLDRCAAELAAEVLDQMRPTPDNWMAL